MIGGGGKKKDFETNQGVEIFSKQSSQTIVFGLELIPSFFPSFIYSFIFFWFGYSIDGSNSSTKSFQTRLLVDSNLIFAYIQSFGIFFFFFLLVEITGTIQSCSSVIELCWAIIESNNIDLQ